MTGSRNAAFDKLRRDKVGKKKKVRRWEDEKVRTKRDLRRSAEGRKNEPQNAVKALKIRLDHILSP